MRTEHEYESEAEAISLAIWEISTGNGRNMDRDEWDSHMQNCHAAVANTYCDDIDSAEWQARALARIEGTDRT